jgi:hypothetical protein
MIFMFVIIYIGSCFAIFCRRAVAFGFELVPRLVVAPAVVPGVLPVPVAARVREPALPVVPVVVPVQELACRA